MQLRDYVLQPMLAQMLLTLAVWIYMYVVRLHFLHRNGVDPELLKTPVSAVRIIPGEVNYAAYNHQNLFELPVIFYSLCLLLYVTDSVTVLTLGLAWTFVALRAVHSAIHCTVNLVTARFLVYMLSSIALWVMLLLTAWQNFLS